AVRSAWQGGGLRFESGRGLCKSAARRRFSVQTDLLLVERAVVWSPLWSPVVAIGSKRSQIAQAEKRGNKAKLPRSPAVRQSRALGSTSHPSHRCLQDGGVEASDLLAAVRDELAPIASGLANHRYLVAVEAGRVGTESLRAFAGEQRAIITS